jgi:hypothetical protein
VESGLLSVVIAPQIGERERNLRSHSIVGRRREMPVEERKWQDLCRAASNEHDPERLITLISELIETLDEQQSPAGRGHVHKSPAA